MPQEQKANLDSVAKIGWKPSASSHRISIPCTWNYKFHIFGMTGKALVDFCLFIVYLDCYEFLRKLWFLGA